MTSKPKIIPLIPQEQAPVEPQLLRVKDVATILDIGETTVYELIYSGELPAIRIGKKKLWRVRRSTLERWISEREGLD